MAGLTQKKLSVDANLVFDLARNCEFAHEFREVFQARGYSLAIPPTAVFELHLIRADGENATDRRLATTALLSLKRWNIKPFDLDTTAEAIAGQFARSLLQKNLLPPDEMDDGLILAQTSLAQIPVLVTSDRHLLDIDENALLLAFNEAHLPPVYAMSPRRMLKALR